jgi:hypothetical protein
VARLTLNNAHDLDGDRRVRGGNAMRGTTVESRARTHRGRVVVGSLTVLALIAAACGGGGGSTPAASNAGTPNPNGVLRVGVDLNDSFSNDFDPGTGTNDCSFQVLEQIYQSITFEPSGTQGNN